MEITERLGESIPALAAMLGHDVLVVVEAERDRWFYEHLFEEITDGTGLRVNVLTPTRFRGGEEARDGKACVLELHEMLRPHDHAPILGGRKVQCLFICDKDSDDMAKGETAGPFLIFTRHYERENYLFSDSDLCAAGSDIAHCSKADINATMPASVEWRRQFALKIKEWVIVCLLGAYVQARTDSCSDSGYGRPAPPAQQDEVERVRLRIRANAKLDAAALDALETEIRAMVAALIAADRFDAIVRGKWYFAPFCSLVAACAGKEIQMHPDSIETILKVHLRDGWAPDVREAVRAVLATVTPQGGNAT